MAFSSEEILGEFVERASMGQEWYSDLTVKKIPPKRERARYYREYYRRNREKIIAKVVAWQRRNRALHHG